MAQANTWVISSSQSASTQTGRTGCPARPVNSFGRYSITEDADTGVLVITLLLGSYAKPVLLTAVMVKVAELFFFSRRDVRVAIP